jgi:hypothetical protein
MELKWERKDGEVRTEEAEWVEADKGELKAPSLNLARSL